MKHKVIIGIALALILTGIVGMAFYKFKFEEDYVAHHQTWRLTPGMLKQLNFRGNVDMEVSFEYTKNQEGYVEFEGKVHPEIAAYLEKLQAGETEFSVNLDPPSHAWFFNVNFHSPEGSFRVVLPQQTSLEEARIATYSSDIRLNGASAHNISVSSLSGDIQMNGITAETLDIENHSGDIDGTGIKASVKLLNRSGDIQLNELEGPAAIENYSGDVTLHLKGSSSVSVLNRSGDVDVVADPDFKGFFESTARSGDILSPVSPKETKDTISVETYSGDIHIRFPR